MFASRPVVWPGGSFLAAARDGQWLRYCRSRQPGLPSSQRM